MSDALHRLLDLPSASATADLARRLAPVLHPGDTILLEGDLGAGKSHFARSLIQARLAAVDRVEDVPSPTFTLVQTYDDNIAEIWHCDLYRLSGPNDVAELGLEEAFESAICLVEWPDRLGERRPEGALTLILEMTDRAGQRLATLSWSDPRWDARLRSAGV